MTCDARTLEALERARSLLRRFAFVWRAYPALARYGRWIAEAEEVIEKIDGVLPPVVLETVTNAEREGGAGGD